MTMRKWIEKYYDFIFKEKNDEEVTYKQKLILFLISISVTVFIIVIIVNNLVENTLTD